MNVVARTRELLGASETRGTGTPHRNLLIRLSGRRLWFDPAFRVCAVDNRAFDGLDRDRRVLDVQGARRFARRWTHTPGDFWAVVGREQIARGFRPVAAVCEVIPVGDLVVDRAADVTIGDTAIHAARRLIARRLLAQRQHKLAIVADSVGGRRITPVRAIDLQKPRDLAHLGSLEPVWPLPISRPEPRSASITRQLYLARTLPARSWLAVLNDGQLQLRGRLGRTTLGEAC